jgi:hypothetical protein
MRQRLTGIFSLALFTLGPAFGLAHAIHVAHSGPDHDSDNCAVCLQLSAGSMATLDDPPAVLARDDVWFTDLAPAQPIAPPRYDHRPLVPRAPPAGC